MNGVTGVNLNPVTGGLKGVNIRVFEWKQKLYQVSDSQGLYMLRVDEKGYFEKRFANLFELQSLLSRDSIESLSRCIAVDSKFFKKDTIALDILARFISVYLNVGFYFTMQNLLRPRKSKIVIVVDVHMFEVCCKDDDDDDEHDDQPCEYGSEVVGRLEIAELSDADSRASQFQELQEQGLTDADSRASRVQEEVQEQELTDDQESLRKNLSNTGACFSYQESDFWDILCTLKYFLNEPIATYETKVLKQIGLAVVDMCLVCMHGFVKGTVFPTSQCVPPADMCPICLQGFLTGMMVSMTPCSHSFHSDCLSQWLPKTNSCPMCRSLCTETTGFTIVYL